MKQQDKKKVIVFAVLMGILAVYWTYHLFFRPAPAAPPQAAQKRAPEKAALPMTGIKVELDLLNKPKPPLSSAKNIFSPVYVKPALVKPPPAPKGKQTVTVTPLPPLPPPPPPKSAEEIAAENAREEIKKIKVLGYLKRKGATNVFMSLGSEHYTVPLGGNITRDYYLTGLEQDSIQITDRATGVSEKIKTQFSEKPTAMPVGAGSAGTGSVGTAPRSVGASPYPGGGAGGGPGGRPGGPAGSGGSGTAITVMPGAVPGPMGGHSVR